MIQYFFPHLKRRVCTLPEIGPITQAECIATLPAALLVCGFYFNRNGPLGWIFQDIIGIGFLCMLQRTLRLPNIKIATLLLTIMFFFDIFWVFLSPYIFQQSVMITVAKGGDTGESVPMLLKIPLLGDPLGNVRLLGFGDVALPGLLVSYLLRHDILSRRASYLSGYFLWAVIGYASGITFTLGVLFFTHAGQPALLYLVPGTLGTTLSLAWSRGELQKLWDGVPVNAGTSVVEVEAVVEDNDQ